MGDVGALKILRDDFAVVYEAQRGVDPLHLFKNDQKSKN